MATATKQRERLTLHETVELLRLLNDAVEEHIDEIELNEGALPDWMASMFDEVADAMANRADAIAAVVDEMKGNVSTAKATKDRAARRENVWGNVIASIKAYALREVERNGGEPIRGKASVLRIQRNGQPSTDVSLTPDQLLAIYDAVTEDIERTGRPLPGHPLLSQFITVQRVATLDTRALSAAYEARQSELEAEAALIGESDIPDDVIASLHGSDSPATPEDVAAELARMRATYVADNLATEFPGVRCVRGHHLRID